MCVCVLSEVSRVGTLGSSDSKPLTRSLLMYPPPPSPPPTNPATSRCGCGEGTGPCALPRTGPGPCNLPMTREIPKRATGKRGGTWGGGGFHTVPSPCPPRQHRDSCSGNCGGPQTMTTCVVRVCAPPCRNRNLVDPASSIRLSQRLSHACLSINNHTVKLRMAHYISYSLFDSP